MTSPPKHLSAPTRRFYSWVTTEFELDQHHEKLLELACGAWDRAEDARKVIDRDGSFIQDRYGSIKPHPALRVEADQREAFSRLIKQLDLDGDPDPSKRRR